MKKILKKILLAILYLLLAIIVFGAVLAFLPSKFKSVGITPGKAKELRHSYAGAHRQFTTSDGDTLFLRIWNPDSIAPAKKDIAVLIFSGITAHSGAYEMAGVPISEGGYTTFGLDYRGHGLSDGKRGDSPGKERWIADLAESVKYIKSLGYNRVVILGHSLGVAAAICAANAVPEDISGLILLSGAYEGKKSQAAPMPFFQKMKIMASAIFRPSFQSVEYYREGMTGYDDPLFNFRYSLRYLTMLDVKKLTIPASMNVPVLVGAGEKDELFDVDKVKEFYDKIPGNRKEFLVMKDASHAVIPRACWEEMVAWLNRSL
ncbi:MAG: alpha/beta fold hydrolase [Bacteroidales bacterium]